MTMNFENPNLNYLEQIAHIFPVFVNVMSRLKPKALREACQSSATIRHSCQLFKNSITRGALEHVGLNVKPEHDTNLIYSFLAKYGFWKHITKTNKIEVLRSTFQDGVKKLGKSYGMELLQFFKDQGGVLNEFLAMDIAVAAASRDNLDVFIYSIKNISTKKAIACSLAGMSKFCLRYLFSTGVKWSDLDRDVIVILNNTLGVWLFEKQKKYSKRDLSFIRYIVKNASKTDPDFQFEVEIESRNIQL